VQLLGDALGLERVLVAPEGLEDVDGGADEVVVGERGAPAVDALVGEDVDEGVDAVVRADLVRPSPLGSAVPEASDAMSAMRTPRV